MKKLLLFKTPVKNLLFALLFTWIYMIFCLFITVPLITLSEAESPQLWESLLHVGLLLPGMGYFIYVFDQTMINIKSSRWLIFPLLLISFPIFGFALFLAIGAAILWLLFFVFPVWIIGIPLSIIIGLGMDLNEKKRKKSSI